MTTYTDVMFVVDVICLIITFLIIYGFIVWILGITIYEFCISHAYITKRCCNKIYGRTPSCKATVLPFTPVNNVSAGPIRSNPIIVSAQPNPYVVASREIVVEV